MNVPDSNLVQPFGFAENSFLEALITEFKLSRKGGGAHLDIRFDDSTPTIWMREGKYAVQDAIPDFDRRAVTLQEKLDDFLIAGNNQAYAFKADDFCFRYASGGTLPVLRMRPRGAVSSDEYRDFYCLFYRDIFPIGWNIANGGCDSRNELLHPFDTVERELREELIIVDPDRRKRYVFKDDAGKPLDHPDFAVARRFWQDRYPHLALHDFEESEVRIEWMDGPDSLTVQIGKEDPPSELSGCFVNITAEDFGIEIDRIAKLRFTEEPVFLDGELSKGFLIGRIIGLFDVDRMHRELAMGRHEFRPDFVYYDGERHEASDFDALIEKRFLGHISKIRSAQETERYNAAEKQFDLCPITRRMIERYLGAAAVPMPDRQQYEIFVSFGGDDVSVAERVYKYLRTTNRHVFFSKHSMRQSMFRREIDNALESAQCLVAVATRPENLTRNWPEYEWGSFHDDILDGIKDRDATRMVPFISGFPETDLPRPLRRMQAVTFDPNRFEQGLEALAQLVG